MVTHDDVRQIATLSKLFVKEEELDALTKEMQSIINFADEINNAAVENEEFDNINNLSNVLREDVVVPSLDPEEILKNAQDVDDNCFLVKKRKA